MNPLADEYDPADCDCGCCCDCFGCVDNADAAEMAEESRQEEAWADDRGRT